MGCSQGAAASLGQNIEVETSYISRRHDGIFKVLENMVVSIEGLLHEAV